MKRVLDVSRKSKTPSRTLKRYVNICTSSIQTMRGVCVFVLHKHRQNYRSDNWSYDPVRSSTIHDLRLHQSNRNLPRGTVQNRVNSNTHVTSSPPPSVVTIESAFVPSTAFDFYFKHTHPDNPAPPLHQGTGLLEVYRTWNYVTGYVISVNHFTHR